jgi:hypothetical protein
MPAVVLLRPEAAAADISLTMYVVKATGSGGSASIPTTLEGVTSDLKSTSYTKFTKLRCVSISLPSGTSEDQELNDAYSVNVSPKGTSKSATITVAFYKGTKKVLGASSRATGSRNAMFIIRGAYKGGALIVIFKLG